MYNYGIKYYMYNYGIKYICKFHNSQNKGETNDEKKFLVIGRKSDAIWR